MNTPQPDGWSDLARRWQADAARVSPGEMDEYLRRERRRIRLMKLAELAGLAAGLMAPAAVLAFTPHVGMGLVTLLFGGVSAWMALRMRRDPQRMGSRNLLHSLKDSIAYEDWLAEQLRLGRALSFVALVAIVSAVSVRLHGLRYFPATMMWSAAVGILLICAVLTWNLVLTVRMRRRLARLRHFEEGLEA